MRREKGVLSPEMFLSSTFREVEWAERESSNDPNGLNHLPPQVRPVYTWPSFLVSQKKKSFLSKIALFGMWTR